MLSPDVFILYNFKLDSNWNIELLHWCPGQLSLFQHLVWGEHSGLFGNFVLNTRPKY